MNEERNRMFSGVTNKEKKISGWKLSIYGAIAAVGVYFAASALGGKQRIIAAVTCGLVIAGTGLFWDYCRTSEAVRRRANLLIACGIFGTIILFLWRLLQSRQ